MSVIDAGKNKSVNKHYVEWKAEKQGKITWRAILRKDIDKVIDYSYSIGTFIMELQNIGYEIKRGKYISLKCDGMERFIRLRSLGQGYTDDDVKNRLESQEINDVIERFQLFTEKRNNITFKKAPKKFIGFQALYWHYMYLLGFAKKGTVVFPVSKQMKKDLLHFERITSQFNFMHKHDIKTDKDIDKFEEETIIKLEKFILFRANLPTEKKKEVNINIRKLRSDLKMVKQMREKIPEVAVTLRPLNKKKDNEKTTHKNIARKMNRSR